MFVYSADNEWHSVSSAAIPSATRSKSKSKAREITGADKQAQTNRQISELVRGGKADWRAPLLVGSSVDEEKLSLLKSLLNLHPVPLPCVAEVLSQQEWCRVRFFSTAERSQGRRKSVLQQQDNDDPLSSVGVFRSRILMHMSIEKALYLVSYSRKPFLSREVRADGSKTNVTSGVVGMWEGVHHGAILGGWDPISDLVLILETNARHGFRTHWAPVDLLWEGIRGMVRHSSGAGEQGVGRPGAVRDSSRKRRVGSPRERAGAVAEVDPDVDPLPLGILEVVVTL